MSSSKPREQSFPPKAWVHRRGATFLRQELYHSQRKYRNGKCGSPKVTFSFKTTIFSNNNVFISEVTLMISEQERNSPAMNKWFREECGARSEGSWWGPSQIWTRNAFVNRGGWDRQAALVCWREILVPRQWIFMSDHFVTCATKKEWSRWWSLVWFTVWRLQRVYPRWPLTSSAPSLNGSQCGKARKPMLQWPLISNLRWTNVQLTATVDSGANGEDDNFKYQFKQATFPLFLSAKCKNRKLWLLPKFWCVGTQCFDFGFDFEFADV